jgi:hypothetical protein
MLDQSDKLSTRQVNVTCSWALANDEVKPGEHFQ